jgi:hypothetical protein
MAKKTRTGLPAPGSKDLAAWRAAIANGSYTQFPLGEVVAAYQDLDKVEANADRLTLIGYLSDKINLLLRRKVSRYHPNEGYDIIERAHGNLIEAVLKPESADGKGLRTAFHPRLEFRLKDAIAEEAKLRGTPDESAPSKPGKAKARKQPDRIAPDSNEGGAELEPIEQATPGEVREPNVRYLSQLAEDEALPEGTRMPDPSLLDGVIAMHQEIDINRFIERHVRDHRKRLAFRLHMEGAPAKSNDGNSISEALGVNERTVRGWIVEVQEILKENLGELK